MLVDEKLKWQTTKNKSKINIHQKNNEWTVIQSHTMENWIAVEINEPKLHVS